MAKRKMTIETLAANIAAAYDTVENSGGLIEGICADVQNLYDGKAVPEADSDFLKDEVSRLRGWNESSARVRKSELGAILANYATLPSACEKVKGKKHVSFDRAVKLARLMNRGMTANQAAAAFIKGKTGADRVDPKDRDEASSMKSAKNHIKRILEHVKLNKKFRAELLLLAQEYDLA